MRIFPPSLEIGDTEGFTAEKDIFGRASLGKGLANLLGAVSDPMVIAVDGQWGSGKTTFLLMLAGELRQRGFPVVYFDAFEHDYADEAFTAIAGQIIGLAEEHKQAAKGAGKRFVQRALGAGKVILRSTAKVGVKLATVGALEAADIKDAGKEIAAELSGLEDKYVGELLTKQREDKATLDAFRAALSELAPLLAPPVEGEQKPLVFIIDELDRCRPHFALQLLERVKHFFSVPNVQFVLGAHLGQLRNSVQVAYGPGIDGQLYLQKFIHLTLPLVERARYENERSATKFVDHLRSVLEFPATERQAVDSATMVIKHIAHHRALSLRTIERIMTSLAIALAYVPTTTLRPPAVLAGLCILRVTAPDLYAKAKIGNLTFDEVRTEFALHTKEEEGDRFNREHFTHYWMFCLGAPLSDDVVQRLSSGLFQYNISSPTDIVPHVANAFLDRLQANS